MTVIHAQIDGGHQQGRMITERLDLWHHAAGAMRASSMEADFVGGVRGKAKSGSGMPRDVCRFTWA
jgi:hypothetical protein